MKGNKPRGGSQGPRRCRSPRSDSGYDSRIHGQAEPQEDQRHTGCPAAPVVPPDQWAIDTVLDRLKGWRPCGDGFAARCPAHADWNPSLSVNESADGHVLLKCHAGCKTDDIVAEVGLTLAHLFTSEYARRFGRRRCGRIAPQCRGRPLEGGLLIDHGKFERVIAAAQVDDDEAFMPLCLATGLCVRACTEFGLGIRGSRVVFPERDDQLRPVGVVYRRQNGKKRCHTGSTRGLMIPVVERGFGGRLYITEGATDALALHQVRVRAIGRPAAVTSENVFGWLTAYLARHADEGVVILGDNDPRDEKGRRVGRDAARELAERLVAVLPDSIPVSWALPRKGYKDAREQVAARAWENGLRIRGVRK